MVALKPVGLLVAFQDEEESLSEAEEHDAVDDGEGEHVPSDHLEDHGDKRPRQLDRSAEEHEIEPEKRFEGSQEHLTLPAARNGKYQHGFFYVPVVFLFLP